MISAFELLTFLANMIIHIIILARGGRWPRNVHKFKLHEILNSRDPEDSIEEDPQMLAFFDDIIFGRSQGVF